MDILSIWMSLTVVGKFYVFCLLVGAAYANIFLVRALLHLNALRSEGGSDASEAKSRLTDVSRRIDNVRQFHLLLMLLSGIVLAGEVFATLRSIRYSFMSLSGASVEVFEPCVAFAFFVFVENSRP